MTHELTEISDIIAESQIMTRDMISFILGPKLGEGAGREVYEYLHNVDFVVKIEVYSRSFQNISEWETWVGCGEKVAAWLAPCTQISPCGIFMIQRRTTPALAYPEKLPYFLSDTKIENFGMLDGKFVCHDYGLVPRSGRGTSMRMVKAKWWSRQTISATDQSLV